MRVMVTEEKATIINAENVKNICNKGKSVRGRRGN